MTEIFCPNCAMLVEIIKGYDKKEHCQFCGITLEKPKSSLG